MRPAVVVAVPMPQGVMVVRVLVLVVRDVMTWIVMLGVGG